MQTRIERQRARYHFDSLHELGEYINREPCTWRIRRSQDANPSAARDLFTSYDKAVELARFGWLEGAERAQDALKAFPPKTAAPDTKVDFYGFRPHVPRYCAGAPNNMIRHTRDAEMGSGRVLTLIIPLTVAWTADAARMANFGVAVAQYVNQMEADGMRVEVIGLLPFSWVNDNRKAGWVVTYTFTIKNADQPLDLAVLSFAIGHPAMLRRLGLALLERCHAPQHNSYGYPLDGKPDDMINAPPGAIILNGMKDANKHAPTPEAALEYVSRQIDKALAAQELPE